MSTFTREYEQITCPNCGRKISAYIPHFGDGSGLRVVKHNRASGRGGNRPEQCSYSERIVVRDGGTWKLDQ